MTYYNKNQYVNKGFLFYINNCFTFWTNYARIILELYQEKRGRCRRMVSSRPCFQGKGRWMHIVCCWQGDRENM